MSKQGFFENIKIRFFLINGPVRIMCNDVKKKVKKNFEKYAASRRSRHFQSSTKTRYRPFK